MFKVNSSGRKYYAEKLGRNYKYLPSEYKFILQAWQNQRRRCYSIGSKNFNNYGKKGLLVEYSLRELIAWYHFNDQKEPGKTVIGRIDHDKGYSLENIRLETKSYSSKERIERAGKPRKPVKIKVTDTRDGSLRIVDGILKAASLCDLNYKTIYRLIGKQTKNPRHTYQFERVD